MRDVTLANPCRGDGWQRDRSNNGIDVITMDETVQTSETKGDQQTREASSSSEALKSDVIAAIRECYDPEIPVNIYDLGLIYDVQVSETSKVDLVMTLTSPHCPVAEILPAQVKSRVELVDGVDEVDLELTWDPPWSPENMSEGAKLELGFM